MKQTCAFAVGFGNLAIVGLVSFPSVGMKAVTIHVIIVS